jgi:hypothetical protein
MIFLSAPEIHNHPNMRAYAPEHDSETADAGLVHYHDLVDSVLSSTRHALDDLRTFIVKEEHQIADIASALGVHDFSHHIANKNLTGATVTLYSNGQLEIRREGQKYATSFPVQLIA